MCECLVWISLTIHIESSTYAVRCAVVLGSLKKKKRVRVFFVRESMKNNSYILLSDYSDSTKTIYEQYVIYDLCAFRGFLGGYTHTQIAHENAQVY